MYRTFVISWILYILLINTLFVSINGARNRGTYTSGIADLVRQAVKHGLSRFLNHQTAYNSDVFRYTFASQYGRGELFGGESCRLSPMICSHDEQCCSGQCLCRRWTITGEERCVRKCF